MTTRFDARTLAVIDDTGAFGQYVLDRPGLFHEHGDADQPLPAGEFAAAVWWVATAPTMCPGYVRLRPDLVSARLVFAESTGALQFRLTVPVRQHRLNLTNGSVAAQDWQMIRPHDDDGTSGWKTATDPAREDRPAVLVTAEIRVPCIDWPLYVPTATRGPGLVRDATAAVRLLTDQLNMHAAPLVAAITRD